MRYPLVLLAVLLTPGSASKGSEDPKPAASSPIYIRAGRLLDGVSDKARTGLVLVVEADRIARLADSSAVEIPAGATVIDLSRATVLPGLIDCHTHLQKRADRYEEIYTFKTTPYQRAFAAVLSARKTLEAGFTTVRDLGSGAFLAVDLRESIAEGFVVGPRIIASGPGISQTGGHGDVNNYSPQTRVLQFPEERDFRIADGVDQVRHVVRAQIKYGVDVIKIHASGGVLSRGDQPGAPQFTLEELRTAVEEAHRAGRKVAAHAHGTEGIKNAVLAGVDSIEHGSLIDDEGIRLMKERGTYLVADIYNDDYLLGKAIELKIPEEFIEKEKMIGRLQRENFARAVRAGVKIAFGTDAGVYPHGQNALQFAFMVRYGQTPAEAIRSATSEAAKLLGREKQVGRLAEGLYADLVAVADDPLEDVRALERIGFVMKGGQIYVDRLTGRSLAAESH